MPEIGVIEALLAVQAAALVFLVYKAVRFFDEAIVQFGQIRHELQELRRWDLSSMKGDLHQMAREAKPAPAPRRRSTG
ncbi:hypothetical protein ACXYL9_12585 [Qipengyuania sp. CAU 1752]